MDLRYPIGKYQRQGTITADQREQWIEDVARTPERLIAAVAGLSDTQLNKPYRPEGWTVRQLVHHVPDSHMNSYVRFRLALTEDEPIIKPYMEARWAELPDARTAPPTMSLRLLSLLHERWVLLMRNMSESDWARTYRHPEQDHPTSLSQVLGLYAWHGKHHVAHITALREREGWGAGA